MQLSSTLRALQVMMDAARLGTHALTDEGIATAAEVLRRAALHAEGLERAVRMMEARQPLPAHVDALLVGLSTGKVAILPVHRTLIAHGFDDRPDLPDRRFGEDRETPF